MDAAAETGRDEAVAAVGPLEFQVSPMSMQYFQTREESMKFLGILGFILLASLLLCSCGCYWTVVWAQEVEKRLFALGDPDAWDPTAALHSQVQIPKMEQRPEETPSSGPAA